MNQEETDTPGLSAADRFDDLCTELVGIEGVTPPTRTSGFGRSALRFDGKIFAMLVRGSLVVKLPAQRIDELVAAGHGVRFDANKGTPMKEWFSLFPEAGIESETAGQADSQADDADLTWLRLALEALDLARASS